MYGVQSGDRVKEREGEGEGGGEGGREREREGSKCERGRGSREHRGFLYPYRDNPPVRRQRYRPVADLGLRSWLLLLLVCGWLEGCECGGLRMLGGDM